MMKEKIILGFCMLLLISSFTFGTYDPVTGLIEKPDNAIMNTANGVLVDWEHTHNSRDRQEFILSITTDSAQTIEPKLILSEYSKKYSDIEIGDFKIYHLIDSTSYEYYTRWCTDHTYTDCQRENNGSYTINGGQGQDLIVETIESVMPFSQSQMNEQELYFEFDINDMVFDSASTKRYKIVFNKELNNGDYGVFSIVVNGFEYWDKTHSSDFLVSNILGYWKFDGDLIDSTPNNYHLTGFNLVEGTGKINEDYVYNGGSSYAESSSFTLPTTTSISLWIKPNTLTSTARTVFEHRNGDNNDYYATVLKFDASKHIKFYVGNDLNNALYCIIDELFSDVNIVENDWNHLVMTYGDSSCKIYVNGILEQTASTIGTPHNLNSELTVGRKSGLVESEYYSGEIDELGIWSVVLDQNNVTLLNNDDVGLQYPFSTLINITFKSQSPNDLDFVNIFEGVNITYTITGHNDSEPVYLNYTFEENDIIVNGSNIDYPVSHPYDYNVGDDYTFFLDKLAIVPSIYNIDPEYMYSVAGAKIELDNDNDRLKVKFNNMTNDTSLNVFEIDLISVVNQTLPVYYCNDGYVNGLITPANIPATCAIMGQIESTAQYNHSHSEFSASQGIDFTIVNGQIGGVNVTPSGSFIITGVSGNSMDIRYISNNTDTIEYSGNRGNSYTAFPGTVDAHLHQYHGNETLNYSACATNLTGTVICGDPQYDNYGELPSFEELPLVIITNPPESSSYTIASDLIITWFGFDGDGDDMTYTLKVDDVVILSAVTNLSYNINLAAYLGETVINVEVCEEGSLTRCTDDELTIIVTSVTDAVGVEFNFDWNVNGTEIVPFTCPTNYIQFGLILLFYLIAGGLMYFGYKAQKYFGIIVYFLGVLIMLFNSFVFVGCSIYIGLMILLIPLVFAVYGIWFLPWMFDE